jgi:hypothetical protein
MPGCALAALGSQALRARPCQFHGQAGSVARGGMSSAVQEAACGHMQQQCFWASARRGPRPVLLRNSRCLPPPAPGHYPDHELEPGAPEGFRARLARADARLAALQYDRHPRPGGREDMPRGHVAHSSLQEGGSSSSTRPIASTAATPASSSTYGAVRRTQRRKTSACPRRASRLPPRIPRRRRSHCLGHREAAPSGARSGGARYTSRIVGGRRHARVATGTSRSPRAASSAWHRREWWRRARDSR